MSSVWSSKEESLFVDGLKKYGRDKDWERLSKYVGSRSANACKDKAKKYYQSLEASRRCGVVSLPAKTGPHPSPKKRKTPTTATMDMRNNTSNSTNCFDDDDDDNDDDGVVDCSVSTQPGPRNEVDAGVQAAVSLLDEIEAGARELTAAEQAHSPTAYYSVDPLYKEYHEKIPKSQRSVPFADLIHENPSELTMVQCQQFDGEHRPPFKLALASTAALVMDVHSHLAEHEIVGLLAGTVEYPSRKDGDSCPSVTVVKAYPCRSIILDDDGNEAVAVDLRPSKKPKKKKRPKRTGRRTKTSAQAAAPAAAAASVNDVNNDTVIVNVDDDDGGCDGDDDDDDQENTIDCTVNVEMDPTSMIEVQELVEKAGLSVVGWYHSHPKFQPDPSIKDIQTQRNYQMLFRGAPFVGLIVGSYDTKLPNCWSIVNGFWANDSVTSAQLALDNAKDDGAMAAALAAVDEGDGDALDCPCPMFVPPRLLVERAIDPATRQTLQSVVDEVRDQTFRVNFNSVWRYNTPMQRRWLAARKKLAQHQKGKKKGSSSADKSTAVTTSRSGRAVAKKRKDRDDDDDGDDDEEKNLAKAIAASLTNGQATGGEQTPVVSDEDLELIDQLLQQHIKTMKKREKIQLSAQRWTQQMADESSEWLGQFFENNLW